jgi:glutamate:GABA antiporter
MIFWYVLFAICFLIPVSLVAAELASTWPKSGGIYAWVKEAYPDKGSFITIWCSWTNNIVYFPTVASFVMVTLAYTILQPAFGNNAVFMLVVMLASMWLLTYFNFTGMKNSNKLSTMGTFLGSLVPIGILIVLACVWLAGGHTSQLGELTTSALLPNVNSGALIQTFTLASSLVLIYAGMEMAGYHARDTRNPKKDYPKAMFFAAALICGISIIGTWAVGSIVPYEFLNSENGMNGGVIEAFSIALNDLGIGWLLVPLGIMLTVGILAQLSTWMIGPAKGLAPAAYTGDLPPIFRKTNKNGAPTGVLLLQCAISSIFVISYVVMVVVNVNGYWVLVAITSLINIIMYFFMFLAFVKLRKTQKDKPRPFKLPGGKIGMWIIAVVSIGTLAFGFIFGLCPEDPTGYTTLEIIGYIAGMLIGVIAIAILPPYIIEKKLKKDSWMPTKEELEEFEAGEVHDQ